MMQIDIIVTNIEILRKKKKLSTDCLANLANIPSSTLSKIRFKISKDVRISTLTAIAQALDCTVNDLIK
jgi:DNA-binding Xre family transcriptional regulator